RHTRSKRDWSSDVCSSDLFLINFFLFKSKWKEINEKVLELADILPYKIEQIRQRSLMTLGIDIGVSRNGNIYIFEVIGAPSTEYIEYSVVNFRSQYYKYLLDQQTELDNMNQIQF